MGIQISHSAKEKYLNCPLSYYMHYFLGFREGVHGSALFFGGAVDEGLNVLLATGDVAEAKRVFQKRWSRVYINGEYKELEKVEGIRYSKADLDTSLIEGYEGSNPAWFAMLRKGEMMIEQYNLEIVPKIKEVIKVQAPIRIESGVGDYITGSADAIVRWEDGRVLVVDNKTTSSKYADNCVQESQQLGLYWEALQEEYKLDGAAYITMNKAIRKKKEPRVNIQTYLGNVDEEVVENTLQEFDDALCGIRMGVFPSNHPKCTNFFGPCICSKYAPSGGFDMTGLIEARTTRNKAYNKTMESNNGNTVRKAKG